MHKAVKEEPAIKVEPAIKQESTCAPVDSNPMLLARAYAGPYPQWVAPTAAACRQVTDRLAALHGWPSALRKQGLPAVGCEERRSVLDSLVRTLLSQNTTDKTSARAFATLKERFPDWQAVRHAPMADVADAIRVSCNC
jgi:endonuclease-3